MSFTFISWLLKAELKFAFQLISVVSFSLPMPSFFLIVVHFKIKWYVLPRKVINSANWLQFLAFYNKTFLHCVTVWMLQQHLAIGDQSVALQQFFWEFSLHNIRTMSTLFSHTKFGTQTCVLQGICSCRHPHTNNWGRRERINGKHETWTAGHDNQSSVTKYHFSCCILMPLSPPTAAQRRVWHHSGRLSWAHCNHHDYDGIYKVLKCSDKHLD